MVVNRRCFLLLLVWAAVEIIVSSLLVWWEMGEGN
jgi:hypothetical protein